MFETTLAPAAFDEAAAGDVLRTPAWSELVARLSATRDLRMALGQARHAGCGSFARFAMHEGKDLNGVADSINPNGLASSKTVAGMVAEAADDAVNADRETR